MTSIERIIAKIDNDFNLDNSDWIPRVGAWVYDALGQLDGIETERKSKWLKVTDRIAYSNCPLDKGELKVYDENGCEVPNANNGEALSCDCENPFNEENNEEGKEVILTPNTVTIKQADMIRATTQVVAKTVNYKDGRNENYIIQEGIPVVNGNTSNHKYVLVGCDKIELNWDTSNIKVSFEDVKTQFSSNYNCNFPVIPDNPIVVEYIAYYCIYKMLCRGYSHPVFNLKASQYGTNPYYEMNKLKDKAKRSLVTRGQGKTVDDGNLWESTLFVHSFTQK